MTLLQHGHSNEDFTARASECFDCLDYQSSKNEDPINQVQ